MKKMDFWQRMNWLSVLYLIQFDKKQKLTIDHFFDKCDGIGREIIPSNDKIISKEQFTDRNGQTKYYFKIGRN